MNGFKRYVNTLEGKPVDFLPRIPIFMQYAAELIGSDYIKFASDYKTLVQANIECAKQLGMDQLSCISDPYRETHGFGSQIEYVKDGPPHSTHPMDQTKDLSVLKKPDPLQSERMLDRISAVRAYKDKFAGQYSIMGWIEGPAAEAADLRDVGNFLMDLMDDEPFAAELMDLCTDVGIAFAKAQVEAGADTIGLGDAIASQVSPDIYMNLIQPREKRLVKAIKGMGAYVRLHICGKIDHLLPGIADLDIDILDVDHMTDIGAARRIVGGRVALAGNINPVSGVMQGNPQSIRRKILQDYGEVGNPFMVNAGCEIPSGTPMENARALCEPVPYKP